MKTQSYRKGWAFVLTLALVFTTLFGGFGFLGINGVVGEVYAATPRSTTLDLTSMAAIDNVDEGWEWDGTSTLTLSGINLSTTSSTGIIVPTNTAIVLVGDDNHVESAQASGASSYGIYAVNGLTISGSGTLTVTGGAIDSGNYTYGIYVDKGSTTINSGTITASGGTASGINGRSIGIGHTGWTLTINGATVTAVGGTASGNTGYSCGLYGESGNLTMNGGTLNAIGGTATNDGTNYGISYIGSIHFNGGTTTVTTNNATQHGAIFGMSGIYLDTDQWISSPSGVGLNATNDRIVTLSDGTTSATSAAISPYAAPSISVNDPSVTEGNSGSINLGFIVSLSAASVQTVTVNYATANGTATAGSDYSSTSGALSFAPGETSMTVNVEISGDTTLEPNETIFLNLSSPTKATISDAQGIGTITNDDAADTTPPAAPVIVTPANGSITNDNTPTCSGTAEAGSTVTVKVDGITVDAVTANGSGNWSYTSAVLAEGSHTVQSTATDGAGNTSANSSSNSFTVDTTQPTLSGATASAITKNSATLNFTSNEAGSYYYLIYASAAGAPDEATIKAQGVSIAKGTAAAIASANTAGVSGLAAATTYKAYVILEDQATNQSAVSTITITTRAEYPTALVNNSFEIPTLGATHATNWWTDYTPTTPEAKAAFGWKTTATGTDEKFEVGGDWNTTGWGIGFIPDGRQFIELNANTQAAAYQDLNTTPGSVIYWSLYQGGVWYSSSPNINNTMAVRIGSPEQLSTSAIMIQTTDTGYDQRWTTRTIYNNATMTAINTTPTTYGAMELTKKILYTEPKRWTKYEGTYEVPAGQTETRFAFASLSAEPTQGNLLDGVVFRIANTTKAITAFNFNGLTPNVTGTINANTIALTVPYGTDVTALVPTITHTGASVSPSAVVAQNFTGPVTYTVTPETGAAQEYVVTVTVAMPTKAITAFNFNGLTPNVTGTVNETAKTIAVTVPYGTDVTALVPTITYSGVSITSNSGIAQNFTSPVTYTVTAADSSTQAYIVTVTVASNGGGGHSSSSTAPANATVNVNGQSQAAGTVSTSKVGDKTVTTVTIDDKKIQEKIKEEGNQSTVSIPIGGSSDIGEGVLNGQTIKDMEKKESILEIKTNSTTYTLPASEINIDSVSSQFGQTVDLKDIKISVKIAEPSADTTRIVEDTANKNNYQVVVKPVEFEITCTSGSKTVSVSKFNGYVERMVAIPDGIDSSKVTTGIVLNNDGTFSHVPTTIVKIDGKYYAKINSLTNSTYSVIYNPIEFADVAKHWAKESINEMGARLVISGVGGNNFQPNRDITRAEFAAIMVRALGLAPDATKSSFSDVADSKWYSGYVGTAASYGIISGYDTDTFAPNDKITREQAMTMVARAMAITDLEATTADLNAGTPLTGYSDTNKISGYAKAGITACLKTGVVTGKTADTIAPKKNITRAEVAVIIERLLKKSELI